MSKDEFRAIAILHARPGMERALVDFVLDAAREIRRVDGLLQMEVSRSVEEPGKLILYYRWKSRAQSQRYMAGPVYSKIAPQLGALVETHDLLLADLLGV